MKREPEIPKGRNRRMRRRPTNEKEAGMQFHHFFSPEKERRKHRNHETMDPILPLALPLASRGTQPPLHVCLSERSTLCPFVCSFACCHHVWQHEEHQGLRAVHRNEGRVICLLVRDYVLAVQSHAQRVVCSFLHACPTTKTESPSHTND